MAPNGGSVDLEEGLKWELNTLDAFVSVTEVNAIGGAKGGHSILTKVPQDTKERKEGTKTDISREEAEELTKPAEKSDVRVTTAIEGHLRETAQRIVSTLKGLNKRGSNGDWKNVNLINTEGATVKPEIGAVLHLQKLDTRYYNRLYMMVLEEMMKKDEGAAQEGAAA